MGFLWRNISPTVAYATVSHVCPLLAASLHLAAPINNGYPSLYSRMSWDAFAFELDADHSNQLKGRCG